MTYRYGSLDDPSGEVAAAAEEAASSEAAAATSGASVGCVMWPVRFTSTAYVLRVTANSVTEDLDFPASGTLTVGRNYWCSGDGQEDADGGVGGVGDLFEMLAETLDTHSELSGSVVSRGSYCSAWLLCIELSQASDLLWAHANTTLDESIFGFTDATASTITGAVEYACSLDHPKGLWRPGRPAWTDEGEYTPIIGGLSRAVSGATRWSRVGLAKAERDLTWRYLTNSVSKIADATATGPYDSFEYMWRYAASLGYPLRWYPDESDLSSTAYTLYSVRDLTWRLASMSDPVYWWEVMLPLQVET